VLIGDANIFSCCDASQLSGIRACKLEETSLMLKKAHKINFPFACCSVLFSLEEKLKLFHRQQNTFLGLAAKSKEAASKKREK